MTRQVPIDQGVIADWTERIAGNDVRAIQATFSAHGARGPTVVWNPPIDRLGTRPLRFLLAYWSTLASAGTLPFAHQIDPVKMRDALGYVALLDIVEDGCDFKYRVFGTVIAAVSEFDLTGQHLSEHPASPYIVEFAFAVYRAVLRRRAPVFTEHSPPAKLSSTIWQRLVLPLADDAGAAVRILSCNVPVPRTEEPIRYES